MFNKQTFEFRKYLKVHLKFGRKNLHTIAPAVAVAVPVAFPVHISVVIFIKNHNLSSKICDFEVCLYNHPLLHDCSTTTHN